MKLSNYRGEDVRKMILKAVILIAVLLGIVFIGIGVGHKYVGKKVSSVMEEMKKKKEERAQQQETMNENAKEDDKDRNVEEERAREGQNQEETETEEVSIHRYEYIVEDCTWQEAFRRCQERGGHLAAIESEEEYDFMITELENNAMGEILFYLGGSRDAGENYYWLNAEGLPAGTSLNGDNSNWCYDKWMQGEPSFYDGDIEENVMALFYFKNEARWVLNDVPEDIIGYLPYYSGKIGYICEYDE